MLRLRGFKPISAGFFSIEQVDKRRIFDGKVLKHAEVNLDERGSDSLGLGARPEDKRLLEDLLINSGIYAFMSF